MKIYLDIETLPSDAAWIREEIASTIHPPGNYKKAETIATWERFEKPKLVEEALARTGLDGGYGRVCCIGWAHEDGPVHVEHGDNEAGLLSTLKSAIASCVAPTFVGHNINFDIRFLFQRFVVNGIFPGTVLLAAAAAKPWDKCMADTMLLWHPTNKIALPRLCRILGVEKGDDVDGSQVAGLWAEGKKAEVAAHCRSDVEAVRACYRRMTFDTTTVEQTTRIAA